MSPVLVEKFQVFNAPGLDCVKLLAFHAARALLW